MEECPVRTYMYAKSVGNVSQMITLADHIKYVQGEDKRHACKICTDAFYKKERLTKHIQIVQYETFCVIFASMGLT